MTTNAPLRTLSCFALYLTCFAGSRLFFSSSSSSFSSFSSSFLLFLLSTLLLHRRHPPTISLNPAAEQEFKLPCGTLQVGVWTHIAFVRDHGSDPGTIKAFVDGVQYGYWTQQPYQIGDAAGSLRVLKVPERAGALESGAGNAWAQGAPCKAFFTPSGIRVPTCMGQGSYTWCYVEGGSWGYCDYDTVTPVAGSVSTTHMETNVMNSRFKYTTALACGGSPSSTAPSTYTYEAHPGEAAHGDVCRASSAGSPDYTAPPGCVVISPAAAPWVGMAYDQSVPCRPTAFQEVSPWDSSTFGGCTGGGDNCYFVGALPSAAGPTTKIFRGTIADMKVWSTALTTALLRELANTKSWGTTCDGATAPTCAALNREPCTHIADTCGPCLLGFFNTGSANFGTSTYVQRRGEALLVGRFSPCSVLAFFLFFFFFFCFSFSLSSCVVVVVFSMQPPHPYVYKRKQKAG